MIALDLLEIMAHLLRYPGSKTYITFRSRRSKTACDGIAFVL